MEKDRSARLIAIVALVLAVTGVSIGFAVLSTNLNIQAPEASVKANNDLFTVYFSAIPTKYQTGTVDPALNPRGDEQFKGNQISVGEHTTTLTGIGGTFTAPGQTITYAIGVSNESKLDGYLTSITFTDVESNKKVKCEPTIGDNQISQEAIDDVCDDIKVTVKVDQQEYKETRDDLTGIYIGSKQTKALTVIITYDADVAPATGDFKAKFGNIVLGFKTEDNSEAV